MVVAVRNEAREIDRCIESLLQQAYPRDSLEFIFVDGDSDDDTVQRINAWATRDDRVRLLKNPRRITSAGMNIGLKAARHELLLWTSGHTILEATHVARCVETMKRVGAAAVGGKLHTVGTTPMGRINAAVLSHTFGVGGGEHRVGDKSDWVFAVTMALYRKSALEEVGGWNESLPRNQDNELHQRLQEAGHKSYMNAEINPTYLCRNTLSALLRQAWLNGFWNVMLTRRGKRGYHLRHFIPMVFVISAVVVSAAALLLPGIRPLFLILAGLYALLALGAAIQICVKRRWWWQVAVIPFCFFLLHFTYGLASVVGLVAPGADIADIHDIRMQSNADRSADRSADQKPENQ